MFFGGFSAGDRTPKQQQQQVNSGRWGEIDVSSWSPLPAGGSDTAADSELRERQHQQERGLGSAPLHLPFAAPTGATLPPRLKRSVFLKQEEEASKTGEARIGAMSVKDKKEGRDDDDDDDEEGERWVTIFGVEPASVVAALFAVRDKFGEIDAHRPGAGPNWFHVKFAKAFDAFRAVAAGRFYLFDGVTEAGVAWCREAAIVNGVSALQNASSSWVEEGRERASSSHHHRYPVRSTAVAQRGNIAVDELWKRELSGFSGSKEGAFPMLRPTMWYRLYEWLWHIATICFVLWLFCSGVVV